jgi:hypothetical protein
MDDLILHVAIPIIMLLLGWIMKQNRDSRIDMKQALEALSLAVSDARTGLQEYRESWMDRREGTLDLMLGQCQQRQEHCQGVTSEKIKQLDKRTIAACDKIAATQEKFQKRFEGQQKINQEALAETTKTNTEARLKWKRMEEHMTKVERHISDLKIHKIN